MIFSLLGGAEIFLAKMAALLFGILQFREVTKLHFTNVDILLSINKNLCRGSSAGRVSFKRSVQIN